MLAELVPGGICTTITVVKANRLLSEVNPVSEVTRCRVPIARELVADIAGLDATLVASNKRITAAVTASGTSLCDIYGVSPICAATIIGYTGDIGPFGTKAQFASYNGTAPIEATSGNPVRHRLNPRGNRTLNFAIHIVAVVQFRGAKRRPRLLWPQDRSRAKPTKKPSGHSNAASQTASTATSSPTPKPQPQPDVGVGPGGHPGTTQ